MNTTFVWAVTLSAYPLHQIQVRRRFARYVDMDGCRSTPMTRSRNLVGLDLTRAYRGDRPTEVTSRSMISSSDSPGSCIGVIPKPALSGWGL